MITKPLLLTILAACGVPSSGAASPDGRLGGDPDENAKAAAAARDFLDRQMQTATTEPPSEQPDKQPPDDDQMDQHFCCQSVDPKTFSGDGCQLITELQVALCNKVLYCEGNWVKDDGKVICG